jgi:hypothetical protein
MKNDRIFATNPKFTWTARRHWVKRERPSADLVRLRSDMLAAKFNTDRFARISFAPYDNRPITLKNHSIGKNARQPNIGMHP